jgi:hypothetical protein
LAKTVLTEFNRRAKRILHGSKSGMMRPVFTRLTPANVPSLPSALLLACAATIGLFAEPSPEILSGDVGFPAAAAGIAQPGGRTLERQTVPTQLYSHGDPTAAEQLMMELVNRARANPGAEAARLGIGLNDGLAAGTIVDTPKQPLGFNPQLIASGRAHSQWMLDTDTFSHTGVSGSSPGDRMTAAGYVFSGSWTWGENIAWRGTTGTPNLNAYTATLHDNLFKSAGHRQNLCNGTFDELGIGVLQGRFTASGTTYNAVMGSQNFAKSASTPGPLLLGVVYGDTNGNGVYDAGEGISGVTVTPASGTYYAVTSTSGGYALPYETGSGLMTVTFSGAVLTDPVPLSFTRTGSNVKLDAELGTLSPLRFVAGTVTWNSAQGFRATVTGAAGTRFVLQGSTDLVTWSDVSTQTLASSTLVVTHNGASGQARRFYRLLKSP